MICPLLRVDCWADVRRVICPNRLRRATFARLVSLSDMQIIRLILAALLAIAAAVAGLFTAVVVAVVAMVAYLALIFRSKTGANRSNHRPTTTHRANVPTGDFIDVVASEVEEDKRELGGS